MISLFDLNPQLDVGTHAETFARDGRVQVRDVLTADSATTLRRILNSETPWGTAWATDGGKPSGLRQHEMRAMPPGERHALATSVNAAAGAGRYAFRFAQYRILDGYLGRWMPDGPHDVLLEHINAPPFLDLVRAITGLPGLIKADAQATLFAAGDFLGLHTDSHVAEGWQVAYVLNLAAPDWKPDWGGYLNFFDADGDIVTGWRPRFNALNLLRVPQPHGVSYVPPFAPAARLAITGWFRDR